MIQQSSNSKWIKVTLAIAGVMGVVIVAVFLFKIYVLRQIPLAPDGHIEEFVLSDKNRAKLEVSESAFREASGEVMDTIVEQRKAAESQFKEVEHITPADVLSPTVETYNRQELYTPVLPPGVPQFNPR